VTGREPFDAAILKRNADVFHEVVPQVLNRAPEAVLVVASRNVFPRRSGT